MKTLFLDIFSGISGDMFLGAMIDLGLDAQALEHELEKLNLDGWHMTATEITIAPGAPPGRKHRHPGFVIGYVLEGQYSFAVNDQAPQVINAGQMFFESFDAPGEVHSASGNASATQPVKFLAIVFTKKGDPVTIPG